MAVVKAVMELVPQKPVQLRFMGAVAEADLRKNTKMIMETEQISHLTHQMATKA